jgi:DNA-binding transcriptional LysR family regulator
MKTLTLDQVLLFLAVVDEGSFSRAARKLQRAQSAVTYGIQTLEAQADLLLFDRSAYRPVLTEAGRALLPRARRIADEARGFRETVESLASGLEAELTMVLDCMFPMGPVAEALGDFTRTFPTVTPRIHVQALGAAAQRVIDGTCMIGLFPLLFSELAHFHRFPMTTIQLVPVVAPSHPLAAIDGTIETHVLQQHVQLVLTDPSPLTAGRDYGVLSGKTWRLADLGAKHSMLLAGLGWGSMPAHLVRDDIERGRLKTILPVEFDPRLSRLVMGAAYLADRKLGPAARWMVKRLSESAAEAGAADA